MVMISIVTFVLTSRSLRSASSTVLNLAAITIVATIGLYIRWIWGQLWIVNWIPLPSVAVLSNWFPILLAGLAAILWVRSEGKPLWKRLPGQGILMAVTGWTIFSALPYGNHNCGDEWIPASAALPFRVCRQTTDHTCSAASVATILEAMGVPATEAEMSELCLTRQGTTWLGMYHGLSIKLMGTSWRVRFFEGSTEELRALSSTRPVLLCCQLTAETAAVAPSYQLEDGWKPGVLHSVVCFGPLDAESVIIGDPSQPRIERWNQSDLENLWMGTALYVAAADETL